MMALVIASIVGWGLWGFFAKLGVTAIGRNQCLFIAYSVLNLVMICYLIVTRNFQFIPDKRMIFPILTGISGAVAAIAFWTALEKLPVAILRPAAALSVMVTVVLAILFLKENLGISHVLGILFALIAIFLLSR